MKKLSFIIALHLLFVSAVFAQMGISTGVTPPDPSAGLDVSFTNKGFLPPRVALSAINSAVPVTTPAVGLLVYNTAVSGTPPNNVMTGYYYWNGTKWIPVTAPQGTNVGDMQYWNGTQWVRIPAGSNGQVMTFSNGTPTWGWPLFPCGTSITINHVAGTVAPVTKSVTYGTVTNIPGENSKCWITSNLGADHQAITVYDDTEASAGWYWQFNCKQGYKHDGTTRTPNTIWITSIIENLDWQPTNDPCALELGSGWRIPTSTEWTNVDAGGGWTNWGGPWNSGLKLHAAGYLNYPDGLLYYRGYIGFYWSSKQDNTVLGRFLIFVNYESVMNSYGKACGLTLRCLRDM